jgi:hypothetical protein
MYSLAHRFAVENSVKRGLTTFGVSGFCYTYSRLTSSRESRTRYLLYIPNFIQSFDNLPSRLPLFNTANTPSHPLSPKRIDPTTITRLPHHQQWPTTNTHNPAMGTAIRILQNLRMTESTSSVLKLGNVNVALRGCNNGLSLRNFQDKLPMSTRRMSWST